MIKGIIPALAEGGKIKIGGLGPKRTSSRGNDFRPPVKLDHFIVTTTRRDANGDLIVDEELMAELPKDADGKCREIPIVLHDDDLERVFPTAYALYSGRKLFCRGDGEDAVRHEMQGGNRTGRTQTIACPCDYLNAKGAMVCKPHGTLHCSIRVPGRAVAGSVYKWRTTSFISIQRMLGSLQQIRDICGTLCGIPLQLKLEPIDVSPPDAPASTVYCCHVELRAADILSIQRQAIDSAQMRARVRASVGYQALLAPPAIDEDPEEEAEVQQEFHPDPAEADTGEVASDDLIAQVNAAIDAIEEHQPGAGMRLLTETTGATDLSALTIRQAERALEALRAAASSMVRAPQRATGNGDATISEPQRKRMYAIYKRAGHSDADVKAWLLDRYGIASGHDIPRAAYDEICERLGDMTPLTQATLA